jgi:hypothetical protein
LGSVCRAAWVPPTNQPCIQTNSLRGQFTFLFIYKEAVVCAPLGDETREHQPRRVFSAFVYLKRKKMRFHFAFCSRLVLFFICGNGVKWLWIYHFMAFELLWEMDISRNRFPQCVWNCGKIKYCNDLCVVICLLEVMQLVGHTCCDGLHNFFKATQS